MFVAISGGLLNLCVGDYPVLVVIGACFGGLIGGSIFKAWAKAMKRARNTFLRLICRFLLMTIAVLISFTFIMNMREQLHLLIAAFIMILLVQPIVKLGKTYYLHLRQRLTIGRGNRRSIHIGTRKKQR